MQGIKIALNYVGARMDIALLTIIGYVDTTTCHELTKTIQDLIKQNFFQIISDLGGVTYVSSAGWGVFVGEIKNIRDRGGDLKIVQMSPEVFEVFEMLEFNKVLNYYDSIEEAIDEFDIIRGIDITRIEQESIAKRPLLRSAGEGLTNISQNREEITSQLSFGEDGSLKDLPLTEKIKRVVIENPLSSIGKIRRQLRSERYGFVRVGFFKLRAILKTLELDTKEKRYRYYRSR